MPTDRLEKGAHHTLFKIPRLAARFLAWSRWEQGTNDHVAVFQAHMTVEASRRQVLLCCLPDQDGTVAFRRYTGYREEIAIDPTSGAIMRLAYRSRPAIRHPAHTVRQFR